MATNVSASVATRTQQTTRVVGCLSTSRSDDTVHAVSRELFLTRTSGGDYWSDKDSVLGWDSIYCNDDS